MTVYDDSNNIDNVPNTLPVWRAPQLTEESIVDATTNVSNMPGDDGSDMFPGYETSGLS